MSRQRRIHRVFDLTTGEEQREDIDDSDELQLPEIPQARRQDATIAAQTQQSQDIGEQPWASASLRTPSYVAEENADVIVGYC
jgi:hypothetical protein